jgi:hypothetical protein
MTTLCTLCKYFSFVRFSFFFVVLVLISPLCLPVFTFEIHIPAS